MGTTISAPTGSAIALGRALRRAFASSAIAAIILTKGNFAFGPGKSRWTLTAGRAHRGCGRISGGSLTGAAVETKQLLALLATTSGELIYAFTNGPLPFHGANTPVQAVTAARIGILVLTPFT